MAHPDASSADDDPRMGCVRDMGCAGRWDLSCPQNLTSLVQACLYLQGNIAIACKSKLLSPGAPQDMCHMPHILTHAQY